jgi:predicted negative regulator of RcsB-dependent stress response
VGTTKLTRKEILAEDPVHEAIVQLIDFFRTNGKMIAIVAAIVLCIGLSGYGGFRYLKSRDLHAQQQLARGMDFFHAEVSDDATDDPYSSGSTLKFKSEEAKYQAAAAEFASVASRRGYAKTSVIARYYLGLSQLKLGKEKEAIRNLETAAGNSRNRTVGFLAKKVLAYIYSNSKNYEEAEKILDGMTKDPQCDLPKEELSLQLSRVLVAQGKQDQAIRVLKEADSQGAAFNSFKQQLTAELEKIQRMPKSVPEPQSAQP